MTNFLYYFSFVNFSSFTWLKCCFFSFSNTSLVYFLICCCCLMVSWFDCNRDGFPFLGIFFLPLPSCCLLSVKLILCWQAAAGRDFKHTHSIWTLSRVVMQSFVFFFPDTNPQCQPLWECVRVCSDGLGCCPPCCHRLSSYHLNSWMALYPSTSLPLWQNWLGRVFHRGLSMAFLSLLTNLWSGPGLKYFVLSCTVLLSVEYLFYCSVLISCSSIQVNMF